MSPITTHVLDTALGKPASGLAIHLDCLVSDSWQRLASGVTNADGRIANLLPPGALEPGTYQLTFDTGPYFKATQRSTFYPYVAVVFAIAKPGEHYHVPLLLSPFGYSTYRGS